MPELPEVETIKRDLTSHILNQAILSIQVSNLSSIKSSLKEFKALLKSNSFQKIERIGKLLIFQLKKSEQYLCVHLRMTGQLILERKKSKHAGGYSKKPLSNNFPNKHTHIIISFQNDDKLFFNDIRKFGYMQIVNKQELTKIKAKFGIEPLKKPFTFQRFHQALSNRKAPIKNLLLNQRLIAGIGNIYADEICFQAGINPKRSTSKLNKKEISKLHKACEEIIAKSIKERGTSFSDYRDGKGQKGNYKKFLKVYGRNKQNCLKCKKNKIIKLKLAGRGTHMCEICQK